MLTAEGTLTWDCTQIGEKSILCYFPVCSRHMLIPYPLSTKYLAKMLKQILACALLVWSLLEVNLTVEKKKHRCLKQKVGDGKTEHA